MLYLNGNIIVPPNKVNDLVVSLLSNSSMFNFGGVLFSERHHQHISSGSSNQSH